MEAVKDFITYISDEWTVIGSAPVSFITAMALTGIAVWFIVRFVHKGEIAGLKATIDTQDQRIELSKERFDYHQDQIVGLQKELDETKAAIAANDRVAMEKHSLAASTIASDVRIEMESTSDILKLPAHLAASSGTVEPVPFEGMDDKKKANDK